MTKNELISSISQNKKDLEKCYAEINQSQKKLAPKTTDLKKRIAQKTEEEKSIVERELPGFFKFILIGLIIATIVTFNLDLGAITIVTGVLAGVCAVAMIAIVVRNDAKYSSAVSAVKKEREELQAKLDNIMNSDEQYRSATERSKQLERVIAELEREKRYLEFNEKLGNNCLLVYAEGAENIEGYYAMIDSVIAGKIQQGTNLYRVKPGAHDFYLINDLFGSTETLQFRINDNSEFIYYKFERGTDGRTRYISKISNTFDEFVSVNKISSNDVEAIMAYVEKL